MERARESHYALPLTRGNSRVNKLQIKLRFSPYELFALQISQYTVGAISIAPACNQATKQLTQIF